jgi:LmbE family N-acetylglucosaminyl deacetylase
MVKKIRKVDASMIIIGHTGKDVHPDIRRLAECVKKVSKKTAEYYYSVNEGKGEGHKRTISGIPKTNWNSYDTKEITTWEWSKIPTDEKDATKEKMDTGDRNMQIVKAYQSGNHPEIDTNEKGDITMQMLADYYDISRPRVSQIISEAIA